MDLDLQPATLRDKPVLRALMQFYLYDFSEMEELEVDDHGVFVYPYLDYYWKEPGRYAFLIRSGGQLAGFALVRTLARGDESIYQMAEFFVMRRYRRQGLGRAAAVAVFDRFHGRWQVDQIEPNIAAQAFWRRVIGDYTGERYVETREDGVGLSQFFSNREGE